MVPSSGVVSDVSSASSVRSVSNLGSASSVNSIPKDKKLVSNSFNPSRIDVGPVKNFQKQTVYSRPVVTTRKPEMVKRQEVGCGSFTGCKSFLKRFLDGFSKTGSNRVGVAR